MIDTGRISMFEARASRFIRGRRYMFVPGGGCSKYAFVFGGRLADYCNATICLDMLDGYYIKAPYAVLALQKPKAK